MISKARTYETLYNYVWWLGWRELCKMLSSGYKPHFMVREVKEADAKLKVLAAELRARTLVWKRESGKAQ